MKKLCFVVVALLFAPGAFAQHTLKIKVIDAATKEPLTGAFTNIKLLEKGTATDTAGMALLTALPAGKFKLSVSHVGFTVQVIDIALPFDQPLLEIELAPAEEMEEEVILQSTRTSRTIKNTATRIEVIELEEIDEKTNMRPGNVSMLLHESTGIQVQQTSATSGNASIRVQGLDGKYTQLLKDGFPNFGNFAGGLSLLEIPPLDLKQVEIIKGPASTLFGGGAIAGVINFISKSPKEKGEHGIVLNQSNVGQTNLGWFSSKRNKKTGYTFLSLLNNQQYYDVDKDDFTELPKSFEFTIHPKFFIYPDKKTTIIIGNSFSKGKRTGGDVQVIKGRSDSYHQYFEENNTVRNITTAEWQKKISDKKSLTVKESISIFNRHIEIPTYHFDGSSYNSFTEIIYLGTIEKHDLVAGANILYDKFVESPHGLAARDNKNFTIGAYIQDSWDASEKIKLESGLRIDQANYSNSAFSKNEFSVLPKISLLIKYNRSVSSRLGAGMGYKLPTLFTEQTETIQYQDVQQLDHVKPERSYGGTADINISSNAGNAVTVMLNHMFFYTWISRPIVLENRAQAGYVFVNAASQARSKGFETNLRFIVRRDFKLFLGYTFIDAKADYLQGNRSLPLIPRSKFNSALIYEKQDLIKLGVEGYYTSRQFLYNGSRTPGFWEFGFMVEKTWKKFSLYVNFENFTDTRQSKFKNVVNGPHTNPVFDDIWTHTEGFTINGGVKIKW